MFDVPNNLLNSSPLLISDETPSLGKGTSAHLLSPSVRPQRETECVSGSAPPLADGVLLCGGRTVPRRVIRLHVGPLVVGGMPRALRNALSQKIGVGITPGFGTRATPPTMSWFGIWAGFQGQGRFYRLRNVFGPPKCMSPPPPPGRTRI